MATRYLAVASTSIAVFALFLSCCNHVWGRSLGLSSIFETPFRVLSPSSSDLQTPLVDNDTAEAYPSASTGLWHLFAHLGGNGPWIPKTTGVVDGGIDVPPMCRVEQVHMLSRHAERYPTHEAGEKMIELHKRMLDSNVTFKGHLSFFQNWTFFAEDPSESFESLVSTGPFAGTLEAFQTGVKLRSRYPYLLDQAVTRKATTFWASDSRRVIDTARYFGAGFFGIDWERTSRLVIISEDAQRGADTLTPGKTCRKYRDVDDKLGRENGYHMRDAWRKVYEPDIIARLAEENPDFTFTEDEIFTMQSMCGFDTIARGESPWCSVFNHDEWESFAYARDVLHYYRTGPGTPYSAAMGWLWLNATADLLRLGSTAGPLFFSFVHDGDVIPLLSALDLFPQHPDLATTHILPNRTWETSDIVPMGGRIILELLACQAPVICYTNAPLYPNHIYCDPPPQSHDSYVRVNVNDGIVAIPGCVSGPGNSCPLDEFLERVAQRGKQAGDFRQVCGLDGEHASDRITFLHQ